MYLWISNQARRQARNNCRFTVKDMLEKFGIGLNIPPFMEGRQQLLSEEVKAERISQNTH